MDVFNPYKIFSKFFMYKLIDEQISHLLNAQFEPRQSFVSPRSFIWNSFLMYSIAMDDSMGGTWWTQSLVMGIYINNTYNIIIIIIINYYLISNIKLLFLITYLDQFCHPNSHPYSNYQDLNIISLSILLIINCIKYYSRFIL